MADQTPSRNVTNDLLVALGVLAMLAVIVLFAVVLASGTEEATARTNTPSSMAATGQPTTPIARAASATMTATATLTSTVSPTTAPPTTSAATITEATATPSPTATITDTPPTLDTPTPTPTPSPTIPSTLTSTPTASATPLPTLTATVGIITPITPSPTVSVYRSPTPFGAACEPPPGWLPYTVRAGQNLFRISLYAGMALADLQVANCITNPASIVAGQIVYVPPYALPAIEAAYAGNGGGETSGAGGDNTGGGGNTTGGTGGGSSTIPLQVGCLLNNIRITSPAPGAVLPVTQPFSVLGTATLYEPDVFNFYKVEIRPEGDPVFRNLSLSSTAAAGTSQVLASVNPALFGPGHYQLVLTVVDETGNFPAPCAIRVTFR